MTEKNKLRGRKARASGQRFERKVRFDLESKGWIVDKWGNNVDFDFDADKFYNVKKGVTGLLVKAKSFMGRTRSNGFPDFIAFRFVKEEKETLFSKGIFSKDSIKETESIVRKKFLYEIIGVESKSDGYLDKQEKLKCQWLLENKIFSKILITFKGEKRGSIEYKEFVSKSTDASVRKKQ